MKKEGLLLIFVSAIVILLLISLWLFFGFRLSSQPEELSFISLPSGFKIETFADFGGSIISQPGPNPGPRMLEYKNNTIFVSLTRQGKVIVIEDENQDWIPDRTKTFIDNLNNPHGIAFYQNWTYIAEENRIIRVKDLDNDNIADLETLEILTDLPPGGHFTRTIRIYNDSLFISVGSSCNICYEDDKKRAAIIKCDLDGKNCELFAEGLRNAVGFTLFNSQIWATENSRDLLGNDLPPDEINIVERDKNYGWPVCYGKQIHDADFDKNIYIRNPCEDTVPSFIDLQAHSAPLGLAFNTEDNFPEEYKNKLFIAYHGSWNRDPPTGYKIVYADINTKEVKDFAAGWLTDKNKVLGRPVDILFVKDSMLISDDNAGKIYRVYYEG